jgi:hypothetical protein
MASSASTSGSRVPPPAGVGPQAVGIDIGGTKIAAGLLLAAKALLDGAREAARGPAPRRRRARPAGAAAPSSDGLQHIDIG